LTPRILVRPEVRDSGCADTLVASELDAHSARRCLAPRGNGSTAARFLSSLCRADSHTFGGPDAVGALTDALYHGEWKAPLRTRRVRAAAAQALRRIGDDAALSALREASTQGSRGVRSAAKTELKRLG
jgi:hypothetical protein